MFLLSDNNDTAVGLRLAGVEGVVIHTKEEVLSELEKIKNDNKTGVLLITAMLNELVKPQITDFINENTRPVVLVIPDRHGNTAGSGSSIMAAAFGLK